MNVTAASQLSELLGRIAQGDVAAFDAFFVATAPRVLARVRRIAGTQFAEDVLSEVFLQVWSTAALYDPRRAEPMAWLNVIARTRALDRLRSETRFALRDLDTSSDGLAEPWHDATPEAEASSRQLGAKVGQLLLQLTAQERTVVGLAYFRDHTHAQIAEITGLPIGTVKTLMHRSHRKLRESLAATVGEQRRHDAVL